MLKLYNTFTRKKEVLRPITGKKVGMYACGPTVYDYAHIGNLRTYIFEDVLRRTLQYNGFEVRHVMNITDVGHLVSDSDEGEDKMSKALKREGKPLTIEAMTELGEFYAERFKEDIAKLNILEPHVWCAATAHIKEQIELIKRLEKKGFTYVITDGVYFDISKFADYGKLGQLDMKDKSEEHARIAINPEKKHFRDFALWKFNNDLGWESPWGKGFPGWHIECSAMSMKYLGKSFDIHCGAEDHIRVHHTNEIAQSEAATGKQFARFWLHGAFLTLGDAKMAKSAGSFITLRDLEEKRYNPLAYRLLVFGTHYRKPMKFTWEALDGARNGLEHLYNQISNLLGRAGKSQTCPTARRVSNIGKINNEYKKKFIEKINDDLNIPQALAVAQDLLKSDLSAEDKLATVLDFDKVLGLGLDKAGAAEELPDEVQKLIDEREEARKNEDWEKSDKLREQIKALGYSVEDTSQGPKIRKI
jgi:cysteinyl-tRNA synthetase